MGNGPDFEQAFVQLVVTHQAALRAFVLSMLPGSPDSDDVIQESNAAVWQKRGEFEIGTNFKAWMFSIAKFKVMSHWRDTQRRKEWVIPEETLAGLVDESVERAFESTEIRHELLRECLQQLRPEDRGLILRRYIDDRRLKELSSEVGRTADSLKVSLHRIRMLLKMCVQRKMNKEVALS